MSVQDKIGRLELTRLPRRPRRSMHVGQCELCGKESELHTHHLIPRWLGGLNGDTMEVCGTHHRKLDSAFDDFIKYGKFTRENWSNPVKQRELKKDYKLRFTKSKWIFSFSPVPNFRYSDELIYNTKTDKACVTHAWNNKLAAEVVVS